MSKPDKFHVVVNYKDGAGAGDSITETYTVSEVQLQQIEKAKASATPLSDSVLAKWLIAQNCKLDRDDGPAYIARCVDGLLIETYYRDGKRHREHGPASTERYADGTTVEWYFRDNKSHREDGPAYVTHEIDGSSVEDYYRDGKRFRESGPQSISRKADGSTIEQYWRDNCVYLVINRGADGSVVEEDWSDTAGMRRIFNDHIAKPVKAAWDWPLSSERPLTPDQRSALKRASELGATIGTIATGMGSVAVTFPAMANGAMPGGVGVATVAIAVAGGLGAACGYYGGSAVWKRLPRPE